ncbi:MAG TPA: hypothetical protein VFJ30_08335 [Phycisphaerae bacterium]|nr:hypothetical protein [Phycisphaerae bacterium]
MESQPVKRVWQGRQVPGVLTRISDGSKTTRFVAVEIPLQPRLIVVTVSSDDEREAELERYLKGVLDSLQATPAGASASGGPAGPPTPIVTLLPLAAAALGLIVCVVIVAVVLLIVRSKRPRPGPPPSPGEPG